MGSGILASALLVAALGATAAAEPGPPRRRVVSTTTSMVILEPIQFLGATPAIDPRSGPMLDTIAETFNDNADLDVIEVRAYGPDAAAGRRQRLGLARARRVVDALVARGVARWRLLPVGGSVGASPGPEFLIVRRRNDA